MALKGIREANKIEDPEVRRVMADMREFLLTLGGKMPNNLSDRALLHSEAISTGILNRDRKNNALFNPNAPSATSTSVADAQTSSVGEVQVSYVLDATSGLSEDTHNTTIVLPVNAIVTRSWIEVTTAFAGGGASVAVSIPTDDVDGILAATAVGSLGVGLVDGIQTGSTANFAEKTTAARTVQIVVTGAALTDGKFRLVLKYTVSA